MLFFLGSLIDCVLYAVGKPVYHKATNVTYGSWLKDAVTMNEEFAKKIWTTYETHPTLIFEFADKIAFRNNQANEKRLRPPGFQVCARRRILEFYIYRGRVFFSGLK